MISSAFEISDFWTILLYTYISMICFQVIGIEMNASAVSDAQKNAEINGITNCKFVCAKVRIINAN